eukprot:7235770-Pyramimonas_sp.AAC.1
MMHSLQEVSLLTLGWGLGSAEQGPEGVAHRSVVREDVDLSCSSRHHADEGQSLSALSGLSQPADYGRAVKTV